MVDNKIDISIIIPMYNVEKVISRCIESILRQSHKEIEIILVNDGSKDNTKNICEKYSYQDSRIILMDQKNYGAAVARNKGIEKARGNYIYFIDADDYIEEDLVEKIIYILKESNADIVQFGHNIVSNDGIIIQQRGFVSEFIDNKECININFVKNKNIDNYLWSKVFKRQLFDNIRIPQFYSSEDRAVLTEILYKCDNVLISDKILYNHTLSDNSICRSEFTLKRLEIIDACEYMSNFYIKKNENELNIYSIYYLLYNLVIIYYQVFLSNISSREEILILIEEKFNMYYKNIEKSTSIKISLNKKLLIFLFNINHSFFVFIYNIYLEILQKKQVIK